MIEEIWFMLVAWFATVGLSIDRDNILLKFAGGMLGIFLAIMLLGESETMIVYAGALLLMLNLVFIIYAIIGGAKN